MGYLAVSLTAGGAVAFLAGVLRMGAGPEWLVVALVRAGVACVCCGVAVALVAAAGGGTG